MFLCYSFAKIWRLETRHLRCPLNSKHPMSISRVSEDPSLYNNNPTSYKYSEWKSFTPLILTGNSHQLHLFLSRWLIEKASNDLFTPVWDEKLCWFFFRKYDLEWQEVTHSGIASDTPIITQRCIRICFYPKGIVTLWDRFAESWKN